MVIITETLDYWDKETRQKLGKCHLADFENSEYVDIGKTGNVEIVENNLIS